MFKNKNGLILTLSFVGVLLFGFVFGHFILEPDEGVLSDPHSENKTIQETNNDLTQDRNNAITRTVSRVSNTIVGINVTEIREYQDPFGDFFGNDPFFRQFFGDRSYKQEVHSLGSGFIISNDGFILTNDHVVGNATKIVITMTNGDHLDAEIIGKDPYTDIALLKVNKNNLPYVNLGNSDNVIIGEWAIAMGNPFGLFEVNQQPTVTVGVISATKMSLNAGENRFYRNMIQTDAAINSGNSGGPLINSNGDVIGMNTIIYTANQYNQGNIGLGFAIPINKVRDIVDQLRKDGKIDRNYWIGLQVQTVDARIAQHFNLKDTKGAIVVRLENGSPAADAGIKVEDVITEVNGEKVMSDYDFWGIITEAKIGDKIKVKLIRGGSASEKEFILRTK